jgi:nucleoside 2-deoxyribosyltransferase
MSGRIKEEVVREALQDKEELEFLGFKVLCPVVTENILPTQENLQASVEQMNEFWYRDKRMIEEADVLFDMTPERKSEGVAHEIGYARYFLYKPVIRVYPQGKLPPFSSVSYYEDDAIVDSLHEALEYADKIHGTLLKRLWWRFKLYLRCFPKMLRVFITSWK